MASQFTAQATISNLEYKHNKTCSRWVQTASAEFKFRVQRSMTSVKKKQGVLKHFNFGCLAVDENLLFKSYC